jgi:RNA polymerase sigma-70 factor (ECF subfamily)
MRRCSGDITLADDLAQQVFLQAWRDIRKLKDPKRFGGWLKRLAINVWLQHLRKQDALADTTDSEDAPEPIEGQPGIAMDLDRALTTLSNPVRSCVVMAYHEGLSHAEIAELTQLPIGTVKSHIRRGSKRLQELLSDYKETPLGESS